VPTAVPLEHFADWDAVTLNAEFSSRMWPAVMSFNGKLWVIAGMQDPGGTKLNDVWSSTNGAYWVQEKASAEFSPRFRHSWTVHNNKMWIIGGSDDNSNYNNDVWYSSNGVDWQLATGNAGFEPRFAHRSVSFGGKLWVISGQNAGDPWVTRDAWYSTDGVEWKAATRNANFIEGVVSFACFTFNNKMWVACGESDDMHNEVYSSSDGVIWNPFVNIPFLTRVAPTYFTYGGMMYIGGGYDDMTVNDVLKDMWRSKDGYNWEKVTDDLSYGYMMKQAAVNFNNRIYLVGGSTNREEGYSVNSVYMSK
ncbi:MAG TPA: hypothetical protein P5511_07665, partial [Candidatus Goldiibacteriota bacterium]|nr:hypothetical protein [Candidatus Goldiibacteriota bacterium]